MSDDEYWIRVTAVGDAWDVEISSRGYYRHRPLALAHLRTCAAEWRPGRPPNGRWAASDQSP